MNPVAMTIINPRKEYWPSRGSIQRPPVLKSATLSTELWGSAFLEETAAVAQWLDRPPRKFDPRPRQTKIFKTVSSGYPPLALRIMGIALRLAHQFQDNGLVKYW